MHIHRTRLLREGRSLTDVVDGTRRALGIGATILPATDGPQRTRVRTDAGWIGFQEYFVQRRAADDVRELRFEPEATPTDAVRQAISGADIIVIAPSNPFVSIGPLLALTGLRDLLQKARATVVAVSPIVGGAAIKGPAAAMLAAFGREVSALGVARLYADIADAFVLDTEDAALAPAIAKLGFKTSAVPTIMRDRSTRAELARATLAAAR